MCFFLDSLSLPLNPNNKNEDAIKNKKFLRDIESLAWGLTGFTGHANLVPLTGQS